MTTHLIRILALPLIVGGTVAAVAQLPSPALLVLDKDDNTLAIIDPATNKIVGTRADGQRPA